MIYKFQYLMVNLVSISDKKKEDDVVAIDSNSNPISLPPTNNNDIECISLGNVSKYSLSETTTDKSKLLESLYRDL